MVNPPLKKGDLGGFQEVRLNSPYPSFLERVKNQSFSTDNQLRKPQLTSIGELVITSMRPGLDLLKEIPQIVKNSDL
jgi:hypothetical protein